MTNLQRYGLEIELNELGRKTAAIARSESGQFYLAADVDALVDEYERHIEWLVGQCHDCALKK